MSSLEPMEDPNVIDPRFQTRRPKAYGEKTIEDWITEFDKRLSRLESQAGTA